MVVEVEEKAGTAHGKDASDVSKVSRGEGRCGWGVGSLAVTLS